MEKKITSKKILIFCSSTSNQQSSNHRDEAQHPELAEILHDSITHVKHEIHENSFASENGKNLENASAATEEPRHSHVPDKNIVLEDCHVVADENIEDSLMSVDEDLPEVSFVP